jgi:hypothetical protein
MVALGSLATDEHLRPGTPSAGLRALWAEWPVEVRVLFGGLTEGLIWVLFCVPGRSLTRTRCRTSGPMSGEPAPDMSGLPDRMEAELAKPRVRGSVALAGRGELSRVVGHPRRADLLR